MKPEEMIPGAKDWDIALNILHVRLEDRLCMQMKAQSAKA